MKQEKRCVIEKRMISNKKLVLGSLAIAALMGSSQASFAQRTREDRRENRQEQRQDRMQRLQQMSPEERQQYFQQRAQERWQAMTPEQRQAATQRMQQMQQQRREQQVRSQMRGAGITDNAFMDIIMEFLDEQQKARQPLLEMAKNIAKSLSDKAVTGEATTTSLEAFRKAVADDKTRYEKALQDLDAKIGYTKSPKIEAFLTLIGILGNETYAVGGPNAIFADQMAAFGGGFGGFGGGGFGGGFGGPGGGGGFGGGGFGGGGNGGGGGNNQ